MLGRAPNRSLRPNSGAKSPEHLVIKSTLLFKSGSPFTGECTINSFARLGFRYGPACSTRYKRANGAIQG